MKYNQAQLGSSAAVLQTLIDDGLDKEEVYQSVLDLEIELVLTAHPTELTSNTSKAQHDAALLAEHDRVFDHEEQDIHTHTRVITELWASDELHRRKPNPRRGAQDY